MIKGYRQDPKSDKDRDFSVGLHPYLVGVTPGDIDLSCYATESHQGVLSSCAGNATAELQSLNRPLTCTCLQRQTSSAVWHPD
jgi:hypothetical protein